MLVGRKDLIVLMCQDIYNIEVRKINRVPQRRIEQIARRAGTATKILMCTSDLLVSIGLYAHYTTGTIGKYASSLSRRTRRRLRSLTDMLHVLAEGRRGGFVRS